jgi:hypothetical protein
MRYAALDRVASIGATVGSLKLSVNSRNLLTAHVSDAAQCPRYEVMREQVQVARNCRKLRRSKVSTTTPAILYFERSTFAHFIL